MWLRLVLITWVALSQVVWTVCPFSYLGLRCLRLFELFVPITGTAFKCHCILQCFQLFIRNCVSWTLLLSLWLYCCLRNFVTCPWLENWTLYCCLRNFVTCPWLENRTVSLSPWYRKGNHHLRCQKLQVEWPGHMFWVRMWQQDAKPKFIVADKGMIIPIPYCIM